MTTHLIYLIFTFHLVLCLGCVAPPSTAINSMPEVATTALSSATSIELISLNPDLNEEPKNDYHGFEMLGAVVIDDIETGKHLAPGEHLGTPTNRKPFPPA